MHPLYAIICTDDQMTFEEIANECQAEHWCPLLAYRHEEKVIIPVFRLPTVAGRFVQRNFTKGGLWGVVGLTSHSLKWMLEKGWILKCFDYPQKICDYGLEQGIEILEFDQQPNLIGYRKHGTNIHKPARTV